MKPIRTLFVLLMLFLLTVTACAAPSPVASSPAPAAPTQAPAINEPAASAEPADSSAAGRPSFGTFTAPGLDGEEYTQELFANADLTMVNIWGTFCGPCIEEMPYLGELSAEYADKGFQIVGVVVDAVSRLGGYDKGIVSAAEDIVAQTGAAYTHLLPSPDLINIKLNQVQYIPETVFVDKNGGIVGEPIVGGKTKEDWKGTIDAYLALVQ